MKIRNDYVTNSSSSSFICDICGEVESGYDLSLAGAGMMECVNGHTFCQSEALPIPEKKQLLTMILENEWNNERWDNDSHICRDFTEEEMEEMDTDELWTTFCTEDEGFYEVPECICPICQFEAIKNVDYIAFLEKTYNLSKTVVLKELKEKFKSYKDFSNWLKQ